MNESAQPARVDHERGSWLDCALASRVDQRSVLERSAAGRVVLLGETHDIAEIHRWQLHVACALHVLRPSMAMGFEMFPRRVQPALDAWVAGEFDTSTFLESCEWSTLWGFDPTLYLPLFHFCRQQRVPMRALNCARPLVTRVGKEGWDKVPPEERDGLTPSAPATPEYRAYLRRIIGAPPERTDFDEDRFVRAQQTWDRAFACNIAAYLKANPDDAFIMGIIGRGHLEYSHGTPFQLADLGVQNVTVLLPSDKPVHERDSLRNLAAAIFRLDTPDPPPVRAPRAARG